MITTTPHTKVIKNSPLSEGLGEALMITTISSLYKTFKKFPLWVLGGFFLFALPALAQETTYHLPKTTVQVSLLIEKTTYTPGDLAPYTLRYFKKNVSLEPTESYRILSVTLSPSAIPDTSRIYAAHVDPKHNIQKVAMSDNNILLAINADPRAIPQEPPFVAARKPAPLDPYKHLSQEILAVGSKLKMAELCSKEIYDIRESRNELTRGQADYMPKDGDQLRLMLYNLERQETALLQLFEGTSVADTVKTTLTYVPQKETANELLFRFSKHYGLLAADDLAGEPYYITVEDLHSMPEHINEPSKKAPKDETGIWVVLPGKARITLSDMQSPVQTLETSLAQFGEVENLNEPLFSKKFNTSLILHPHNGGIDKIESVPVK